MLENQEMESVRNAVRIALEGVFSRTLAPFSTNRVLQSILDLPEIGKILASESALMAGVNRALDEAVARGHHFGNQTLMAVGAIAGRDRWMLKDVDD